MARFWTGDEWRPLSENEAAYRRDAGFDVVDDDDLSAPAPVETRGSVEARNPPSAERSLQERSKAKTEPMVGDGKLPAAPKPVK